MYNSLNNIIRDDAYATNMKLSIKLYYGISILSIEPAKRGFYGETWKINTIQNSYFVKIVYSNHHKPIYRRNLSVIEYMYNYGIQYINKLIKTINDELFIDFQNGVLAVFEFIPGIDAHNNYEVSKLFHALADIYTLPTTHIDIEKEDFNTERANSFVNSLDNKFNSCIQSKLLHYVDRMNMFAERCKKNTENLYITHGDASSNVMFDKERLFIVDWDYPKLAAPERDAWVFLMNKADLDSFSSILHSHGINYSFQPDRIAYYCYHSYFYYLQENLTYHQSIENDVMGNKVFRVIHHLFFRGWIQKVLKQLEEIT